MGDRTNGRYPSAFAVLTSRRYMVFHRSCAPSAISVLHSNSNSTQIIDYHFFVSTSHIVDTSLSITFTTLYSNFVDRSNLKTFPPHDRTRWNIIIESWESLAVFSKLASQKSNNVWHVFRRSRGRRDINGEEKNGSIYKYLRYLFISILNHLFIYI